VYRFSVFITLMMVFIVSGGQNAQARLSCEAKSKSRVNVTPVQSNIVYDFSKSKAQLNRMDVDTISPYGPQHKTNVSGLMSGSIQLKSNVAFMHETYKYLGRGCVYLKGVDVEIHLEPTIFIANDYKRGGCMYNAILAHEFKHVREDQLIINKYTNLIGQALEKAVARQGNSFGPMRLSYMPEIQLQVKNAIEHAVLRVNDRMNKERQKRQQAIDTIEEYDAVGRRCKDKS
jgi:hypothetical protein